MIQTKHWNAPCSVWIIWLLISREIFVSWLSIIWTWSYGRFLLSWLSTSSIYYMVLYGLVATLSELNHLLQYHQTCHSLHLPYSLQTLVINSELDYSLDLHIWEEFSISIIHCIQVKRWLIGEHWTCQQRVTSFLIFRHCTNICWIVSAHFSCLHTKLLI